MENIKFANQLTAKLKKYLASHKIQNDISEQQWNEFTTDIFMTIQNATVDNIINRLEKLLANNKTPYKFKPTERNQLTHIIGSLTMRYLY